MIRSLLIAVICFVCGVLVGKIAPQHAATAIATDQRAQESKAGSSNVQAPCTAQAQTSHSTAASQGAADITVSNQFTKSAKIIVAQPKSVPVQVLDADTEAKALELISAPLPSVRGTFQKQGPDGSVDVFGKSDDGRSFYRHFNPKGELTKEGWNDSKNGESLSRGYYETGELKFMSWTKADKSLVSIEFTQSGLRESRFDRLADGTTYATDYDDAGEVKSIWQTTKDGAKHQLFPEKQ